MNNVVEIILNIIFGIIVPILVPNIISFSRKEKSSFYSYLGSYNKNVVKSLNINIFLDLIIIVLFHVFFTINCFVEALSFDEYCNTCLFVINAVIIVITLFALKHFSTHCFKDKNMLDKILDSKHSTLKWCNFVLIWLSIIIGFIVLPICIYKIVIDDKFIITYIFLYYIMFVLLCIIFVFTSYVQNYVNVRALYHVESINIKLKGKDQLITKVLSYEKIGDRLIMIIQNNGSCKSIETNYSNIEYIEKIIDEKQTMLSMLQNEKDEKSIKE